jgi:uncharacterized protein YjbI with pentapeptide repeats
MDDQMDDKLLLDYIMQEGWNLSRAMHPGPGPKLHGVKFAGANLTLKYLDGTDFSSADLSGAVLDHARLSHANLSDADLSYVNLNSAGLKGANLERANLQWADLKWANLSSARLAKANLNEAVFNDSDLSGADFTDTRMGATVFVSVCLDVVVGLDSVKHAGPSFLDLSTFEQSRGSIPEKFLRGCGLKDWEIEAARLYTPGLTPERVTEILYKINDLRSDPLLQFYSCFISYSHADKVFARRLHDALQRRGVRCWFDERQLLPGHDVLDEVGRGIRFWDKVLLCCSKDSLTSWWVDNEINSAFAKEQRLTKQDGQKARALIPLNLDGYLFSGEWHSGKVGEITSRLAADFTDWDTNDRKFDEQLERLVRALRTDEGREAPPPARL